jgi:predicted PurR-regulated permease PerM
MDTLARARDQAAPSADGTSTRHRVTISITSRTIWLAALVFLAILASLLLISKALGPVTLFILAIILGEAIRPLVAYLGRYHIPGPVAVLLIYLVVLGICGVLVWLFLTPLLSQIGNLSKNIPLYMDHLQTEISQLERTLRTKGALTRAADNLGSLVATAVQRALPGLVAVPFGFLSGIFAFFIDLVVTLTMTLFWLMSSQRLKPFVVSLFPAQEQERAGRVMSEVGRCFGGYVRGTLISMVLIGLLSGLGLAILGVPYALLLGILAGFTELLPYLGPWISGSVAVVMSLITVGPLKALEVIILFILIQEIEGNVVEPLVMSKSVNVDPLVVIISVLIGINLLGIIGAILAVPIAAGIQVLVARVLAPAIRRASAQREISTPAVEAATSGS